MSDNLFYQFLVATTTSALILLVFVIFKSIKVRLYKLLNKNKIQNIQEQNNFSENSADEIQSELIKQTEIVNNTKSIDKVDSDENKLIDKNEIFQKSKSKFSFILILLLITTNILLLTYVFLEKNGTENFADIEKNVYLNTNSTQSTEVTSTEKQVVTESEFFEDKLKKYWKEYNLKEYIAFGSSEIFKTDEGIILRSGNDKLILSNDIPVSPLFLYEKNLVYSVSSSDDLITRVLNIETLEFVDINRGMITELYTSDKSDNSFYYVSHRTINDDIITQYWNVSSTGIEEIDFEFFNYVRYRNTPDL